MTRREELIKSITTIQECDGVKWDVTPEQIADYIINSGEKIQDEEKFCPKCGNEDYHTDEQYNYCGNIKCNEVWAKRI